MSKANFAWKSMKPITVFFDKQDDVRRNNTCNIRQYFIE
jgi:hypothetical protein